MIVIPIPKIARKPLAKLYFFADGILFKWLKIPRTPFVKKISAVITRNLKSDFAKVHGHSMYLDKRDSLGLSLLEFEPATVKLFEKYVKPGHTVLDIGAHIGYFALIAARLVGNNGRVFAYEPEPENFAILKKNVETNKYNNVCASQFAIAERARTARLFVNPAKAGGHMTDINDAPHLHNFDVKAVALDDELKNQKVDFIKIDIEGGEYNAFLGMEKIIANNPQIKIVTEYYTNSQRRHGAGEGQLIDLLKKHGFNFYEINDKLTPISYRELKSGEFATNLF